MKNLQIFSKENLGSVRTILVDNEVWFCIKDVCNILELTNPTVVAKRLDEDEKAKFDLGLKNGELTNFTNESGLYNLILRSDKKEAKPFIKWITKEVIPAIRKTGMYANQKLLLTPSEMRLKIRYYDSKSKVFNSINRLLNNDHMTEELRNALTGNIKDILSNDDNLIQTRAQQDNEEWDRNDLTDINAKNVNGRTKRVFVN